MPSAPQPRVLYVDDDEDSRTMLIALLKEAFIDAKAVETATEALSLVQDERFDLYMLDSWLPDIDGLELCRRLRNLDPSTPIMFFSGAAYESDKLKGIAAGANAYVVKPDIAALLGNISQFVPQVGRAAAA